MHILKLGRSVYNNCKHEERKSNKGCIQIRRKNTLTVSDNEMDARAVEAVKAAINNAKVCKKSVAGYDKEKKAAYVEYANGEGKYAE